MFEVGKGYQFRMMEGGSECTFHGVVAAYEPPLLKLADKVFVPSPLMRGGGTVPGMIINTASASFISAERERDPSD